MGEGKNLIIVSIGYSACHWCHVMERESFENEIITQTMNTLYVPIKIDREKRSDIDQSFMITVQLMSNAGDGLFQLGDPPVGTGIWQQRNSTDRKGSNVLEKAIKQVLYRK